MNPRMFHVSYLRIGRWAALLACVVVLVSCSDDGSAQHEEVTESTNASWAIHVYARLHRQNDELVRMDFRPAAEVSGVEPKAGGVRPQRGVPIARAVDTKKLLLAPVDDGWNLVMGAAAECGMIGDASGRAVTEIRADPTDTRYDALRTMASQKRRVLKQRPVVPPWSAPKSWYIFPNKPATCDELLEDEETLLCIADKLAVLSDAIAPQTWENVRWLSNAIEIEGSEPTLSDVSWVIPPQGDRDKFIARDLAFNVLAHIPRLDALPMVVDEGWPASTCLGVYSGVEFYGGDEYYVKAYGTDNPSAADLYPPADSYPFTRERFAWQTNTLRAAGLLLHDLIRSSVYADLGGAASRSATASDPKAGNGAAWNTSGASPYNSIAHATRVLLGRWEGVEGPNADLKCGGLGALELLKTLDPQVAARTGDTPPMTGKQARAAELFELSGLVLANDTLAREALETQLLGMKAKEHDIPAPTYSSSAQGLALKQVISGLSDSDLAFASARNRATMGLLSGVSGVTPSNPPAIQQAVLRAGMAVSPVANGAGVAVEGGLGRYRVTGDVMAHAGPMMRASQCTEPVRFDIAQQDEYQVLFGTPAELSALSGRHAPRWAMQDVFSVAQALRARMVKLHEIADGSAPTSIGTAPDARARAATVAELGAWAGSTRALIYAEGQASAPPASLTLELQGLNPRDFGFEYLNDLLPHLRLAYGDPTDAECVANVRPGGCGAGPDTNARWVPSSTEVLPAAEAPDRRASLGMTHSVARLKFSFDGSAPPALREAGTRAQRLFEKPLFIVSAKASPMSDEGKVFGAVGLKALPPSALSWKDGAAGFALSPMRQELLRAVLGVGKWVGAAPPRVGEGSLASSPQYCVEGVPRDLFVPLENELTSDGDAYESSWRHYLNLARDAAKRADELGQTWVDVGFQRDVRAETGAELLHQQTGQFVDVGAMKVDENGNVDAGDTNGALKALLGGRNIDLVFFTSDPFTGKPDKIAELKKLLPCGRPTATDHPLCARLNANSRLQSVNPAFISNFKGRETPDSITYTVLNLAEYETQPSTSMDECREVVESSLGVRGAASPWTGQAQIFSGAHFASGMAREWGKSEDTIQAAVYYTRMIVDMSGHWRVVSSASTVMDTDSTTAWPGCLRTPASCGFDDQPNPARLLNASLNGMFRRCTGGDPKTAPLGGCGDGDADGELNAIRWRVEGALWLLGAMTGNVHEGMFTTPLPAANFASEGRNACAPLLTVYGDGAFEPNLQGFKLGARQVPGGEWDALTKSGAPASIAPSFGTSSPNAPSEVPDWLRAIYTPATVAPGAVPACRANVPFVHVLGSNVDGPTDYANLIPYLNGKVFAGNAPNRLQVQAWSNLADKMGEVSCPAPAGGYAGHGLPAGELQGLVASLKTQQKTSGPMRAEFFRDDHLGWFFWSTSYRWENGRFEYYAVPGEAGVGQPQWFHQAPTAYHWVDRSWLGAQNDHYATYDWHPTSSSEASWHGRSLFNREERWPSRTPPNKRVRAFVNSGAPNGDCGAAWQFTQAAAMACVVSVGVRDSIVVAEPPKNVTSVTDLQAVESWLRVAMRQSRQTLSRSFLEDIPAIAVERIVTQRSTPTAVGGEYGKSLDELTGAMLEVPKQWNNVALEGELVANDIQSVRLAVERLHIARRQAGLELDIQRFNVIKDMAQRVADGVPGKEAGAAPWKAIAQAGASLVALGLDIATLAKLDALGTEEDRKLVNETQQALVQFQGRLTSRGTNINNGLIAFRQAVTKIKSSQLDLANKRSFAAYQAGKSMGLGVWQCGTEKEPRQCKSQVNTVLNRRYSGYERRYKTALRDAKALAYAARRAIEQRVGLRLEQVATRVGPLEPPSTWADDICRLTGIDYKRLRTEPDLDAGTADQRKAINAALAAEFADGFVGDYVEKLARFVDYYNLAYPAKDGDDTAVLSLREDVYREGGACLLPSRNLLAQSSHLDATVPAPARTGGWQKHACGAGRTTCLHPRTGGALGAPSLPPLAGGFGGATWLVDQPRLETQAGVDLENEGAIDGPTGLVSQAVDLAPGRYVLTWWDQARAADGKLGTVSTGLYRAVVLDESRSIVTAWTGHPHVAPGTAADTAWGPRRTLTFDVAAAGTFRMAFGASLDGAPPGSVAVANVQLERVVQGGGPTAYQDTDSSGRISAVECHATPQTLRAQFVRSCDAASHCYYETRAPIVVDTQAFRANGTPLTGKLAQGNFNFRHIDLAVNLVGTAVHDCTGASSSGCLASGFIEYTLRHDGTGIGVLGYDKESRIFDFGIGAIERGKALTAERHIAMPIAGADQNLISQPGILKTEFRGRPLDGRYYLRIYEAPAVRWERLEDIQLVLKYRYWSRIQTPGQP